MILTPVLDVLQHILDNISPLSIEKRPITACLNRVLAEDVIATDNIPPFKNSAMDGYAVIAADVAHAKPNSPVHLRVTAVIAAGETPSEAVTAGCAARIMTGAPMPKGADAVVRFEDTQSNNDGLVSIFHPVRINANVRPIGEDVRAGNVVLPAGHTLRPQDIGIIAAVGRREIMVYRVPRVAILATGDELVEIDEPLSPGKIRNSNEYSQYALIQSYGAIPIPLGIAKDNAQAFLAKLEAGLAQNVDLILTSAGVSAGDYDVVKQVLSGQGDMQFWQIAIKPGKPLGFGHFHGIPIIGLPGNPVASMVAFEVFARATIMKLSGHRNLQKPQLKAIVQEDIHNSGRRHYMRAYLYRVEDEYRVTTRGSDVNVQGSGILSSMVWANSLVVVPNDVTFLPAGSSVEVWLLDWRGSEIPKNQGD